jgi:transcriptional regulator GlxA family with amidase domain
MMVNHWEGNRMSATPTRQRIAVVLFDRFTVLDVYGPAQAFASCRVQMADGTRQPFFELFSMAERPGVVRPGEGPPSYAEYSFVDAPDFDIVLIPGGLGTRTAVNNETFLKHLGEISQRATITTTVCTGSALLARTGLLDGRPATSNKIAWDWVVQQGPRVKWMRQARWIDDGNIVTSSGVSAGIDMALGLIARLHGRDMALASARYMEYRWHEDAADDPFA